jgi:8-oxo-dGTP pyrophosphatase MutT (NUDIX family)
MSSPSGRSGSPQPGRRRRRRRSGRNPQAGAAAPPGAPAGADGTTTDSQVNPPAPAASKAGIDQRRAAGRDGQAGAGGGQPPAAGADGTAGPGAPGDGQQRAGGTAEVGGPPRRRRRRRGRRRSGQGQQTAQDQQTATGPQAGQAPQGQASRTQQNRPNAQDRTQDRTQDRGQERRQPKPSDVAGPAKDPAPEQPKRRARAAAASSINRTRRGGRRLRTVDETSAGGLVVDALRESAALIGRLDRRGRLLWSLPKGHLEAGETPEQAAIREVAEETGIQGKVIAPLGTIDYWFVAEDRRVHKTVHHFLMEATGGELCDEDVEVTEVAWVPLAELDTKLAYADERRLVRLAADLLTESA